MVKKKKTKVALPPVSPSSICTDRPATSAFLRTLVMNVRKSLSALFFSRRIETETGSTEGRKWSLYQTLRDLSAELRRRKNGEVQ